MNHLIISAAFGYKAKLLEPFLISIRTHGGSPHVILLRERHDPAWEEEVRTFYGDVEVICPHNYLLFRLLCWASFRLKWLCVVACKAIRNCWVAVPSARKALEHVAPYFLHVSVSRYLYALRLADVRKGNYDSIMLADVRDVIFQSSPFVELRCEMVTGEEDVTFGDSPCNLDWLAQIYPSCSLESWSTRRVLCSGLSFGPVDIMHRYLEAMRNETLELLPRLIWTLGLDQPMHNHLLRERAFQEYRCTTNDEGVIATLSCRDLNRFECSESQGLQTSTGKLVKLVHQYDRYPAIQSQLLRLLGIPTKFDTTPVVTQATS